jgi:Skp family chaperone for outer membrane proteins
MKSLKNVECAFGSFVSMAVIALLVIAMGSSFTAQKVQAAETEIMVGTYDEQQIFLQHPSLKELQDAQMKARQDLQEAQENDDQEKSQQIYMDFSRKQQEIIQNFQDVVAKALPEVAENTGVQVIATQVKYATEGVKVKDITSDVMKAIGIEESQKDFSPEDLQQQ